MLNDKNIISCPACEYERNSHGQPIENNGQMKCLDCGSSWRVFGTASNNSIEETKSARQATRVRKLAEQVTITQSEVSQSPGFDSPLFSNEVKSNAPGLGTVLSCLAAILLFVSVYVGVIFLKADVSSAQVDFLNIAEVKLEEQVRRNGEKVFTVRGLVSNPTSSSKPIPPIAIILRKQNGNEITRWYYNSSLVSLRPGGKSRFASSIQYDTPIVAYAEAVFK